jgi:hypothetical protein
MTNLGKVGHAPSALLVERRLTVFVGHLVADSDQRDGPGTRNPRSCAWTQDRQVAHTVLAWK